MSRRRQQHIWSRFETWFLFAKGLEQEKSSKTLNGSLWSFSHHREGNTHTHVLVLTGVSYPESLFCIMSIRWTSGTHRPTVCLPHMFQCFSLLDVSSPLRQYLGDAHIMFPRLPPPSFCSLSFNLVSCFVIISTRLIFPFLSFYFWTISSPPVSRLTDFLCLY